MKKYTFMQRKEDVVREWHHYDAEGQILGKIAVEIAKKLMGKEDYVVVTNASKLVVTGKKLTDKVYYNHSGYPGGIRARKLGEILEKKPEELLMLAVKRMLPKNKLGRQQLTRLRVFAGAEHSHVAQKPNKVEL